MISEDESLHGRKAKRLKLDEDQEQKSSYIQEWHAKQSFYIPDSDKNTTLSETCDSGIGSSLYPPSELGIEVTSGKLIINFIFSGLLLFAFSVAIEHLIQTALFVYLILCDKGTKQRTLSSDTLYLAFIGNNLRHYMCRIADIFPVQVVDCVTYSAITTTTMYF